MVYDRETDFKLYFSETSIYNIPSVIAIAKHVRHNRATIFMAAGVVGD